MNGKTQVMLARLVLILTVLGVQGCAPAASGSPGLQTDMLAEAQENLTSAAAKAPDLGDRDALEAFMDGAVIESLNTYHLAGATVAVVQDGEILLAKGYGFSNVEAGSPVDGETTLFRIGSISKLFTWTAVMQLAEQGKLDLDADVNTYLDFEIPATYPQPITMKHLMTHRAGFEEMGFRLFAASPKEMISNRQWLMERIPARVQPPGKVAAYSNYGTALAGYIVERISGLPYEDYIQQSIFNPLAMQFSTASQPLPGELAAHMSQGFRYNGNGFDAKGFEVANGAPAGAISASATDMAHFMIAHLNGGTYNDGRILRQDTIEIMHSRLWGADDRLNGWAYGFYEMNQNGLRVIGHAGDTVLFHSLTALVLDERVGLFISYNTQTNSMAPQKIFEQFMDHYYPETPVERPAPPPDTLAHAARVAGSYRVNRSVYTRGGKIDSLQMPIFVQAGKDGTITIPTPVGFLQFVEVAPYYYEEIDGDDKAVFRLDEEGRVTYSFINSFPMLAAERVPWYESAILHLVLIALTLLLSLSTFLAAIVGFFVRRKRSVKMELTSLERSARWVLGLASLLCLAFIAVYAITLTDPLLRLTGQRGLLDALSWIALGVLLLAAGAIVLTIAAWLRKSWGLAGRIHYTLVTASIAIYAVLLTYYNQIGWQW